MKDKGTIRIPESAYQDRIAAAKSVHVPVGGVPRLDNTPRFDHLPPPAESEPAKKPSPGGRILTNEEQESLRQSGTFLDGIGAAYARNQPVSSAPSAPPPTAAIPPSPKTEGLREETLAGVNKLAEEIERQQRESMGEDKDDEGAPDHHRRKRRREIETRCEPLSLEDLVIHGELRQEVPIVPGQLRVTFRSTSGEEDLFVKRLASFEELDEGEEDKHRLLAEDQYTNRYLVDRFLLMNLALGVYAINGRVLPAHLDDRKRPQPRLFWAKYRALQRLPGALIYDLSVNYSWFTDRLQKLTLGPEAMKDLQGF